MSTRRLDRLRASPSFILISKVTMRQVHRRLSFSSSSKILTNYWHYHTFSPRSSSSRRIPRSYEQPAAAAAASNRTDHTSVPKPPSGILCTYTIYSATARSSDDHPPGTIISNTKIWIGGECVGCKTGPALHMLRNRELWLLGGGGGGREGGEREAELLYVL